jgi:predicted methyltransferase
MNDARKLAVWLLIAACGSQRPEPVTGESRAIAGTEASAQVTSPPPALAVSETTAAGAPAVPSAADRLRAEMAAEQEAELERLTPELRSQAQALAERRYPNAHAALQAVIKSPHRKAENVARDGDRRPSLTLEFLGFQPQQKVLEYGPGAGWYTEILAPALANRGKLIVTNTDPDDARDPLRALRAQRFNAFLARSPELFGKVQLAIIDPSQPALPGELELDMVLLFRGMHGMVNAGTLQGWLEQFRKALKPRGVLGVEQHRAAADADPLVSAKQGYLPEAWVIAQVQAAGFKLVARSEINANPRDTKDYPEGVWTLPPTYKLGDQEREKYEAIGESDRMTLKFVKVEQRPPMSPFVP